MLEENDLDAAVSEGIITAEQMEKLRAFAGSRRLAADRVDDERFRFMRGFNDFFFAVGIVLFAAGMIYFAGFDLIRNLVAAAIIWGLAEFLVGRMRLVLPGILLAFLFSFFVFRSTQPNWALVAHFTGLPFHPAVRSSADVNWIVGFTDPIVVAGRALGATLAAAVFYLRFRLPFALLLIAGGVVLFVAMIVSSILLPGPMTHSLMLLVCGLAVFAAAMAYDLSDRMRLTRSSDCAFWLHLLAAPLIVHSLIRLLLPPITPGAPVGAPFGLAMTPSSAITIFVIVACLAAIAILIDRRALLVSALTYLGVAIGYTLTNAVHADTGNRPVIFFATVLILGAMVLALGVGWQPLRRLFLGLFSAGLVSRLPPAGSTA